MMLTLNNIYLFMADFSIKYTIYIVELGAIKASAGREVLLGRRHIIAEATPLVRNKNKNKKPITPVHCEQYTILHFPTLRSAVHCRYNQHLQYRQRLSFLDYERSHFVIMFQHLHNICVRPGTSC
jgi:hypothetical protein